MPLPEDVGELLRRDTSSRRVADWLYNGRMRARDTRRSFLDYFARHGHRIVDSAPLVPEDDATLLFTNAGMNQFKAVFQGRERRAYTRAVTAQKCMRVSGKHNDLDTVGRSLRHHTFFEMLGNFSFGDYFKDEAIAMAWTLLVDEWDLPADRLRATVFEGDGRTPRDDDAYDLWRRFLPADRIDALGAADNFWAMGDTGPCGRCSEIHFHQGDDRSCAAPTCLGPACDCDRYIELWNNVFMEFDRQDDGSLVPLPTLSIDTGMGLERAVAVLQGVQSSYDTDLFQPLLRAIADMAGTRYGADPETDVSLRVVADHVRATTFLIGDSVTPSNEWRGYVLRKIMRRAMRHGKRLGLTEPFLHLLVDVVVDEMQDAYPTPARDRRSIAVAVRREEDRFDAVLTTGLPKLEDVLARAAAGDQRVSGEDVFRLYDSLGLPADFVEDLAREQHLAIDWEGFEHLMADQRERARAASGFKAQGNDALAFGAPAELVPGLETSGDRFEGYDRTSVDDATILMIWNDAPAPREQLHEGDSGYLALDRTPFYLDSGGQVSDTGTITSGNGQHRATVVGMTGWGEHPRLHKVRVTAGTLSRGDVVTAAVDTDRRDAIRRNHTATHLLHAALQQVLGTHAKQAGSLVAPDRLRFDFAHPAPVSPGEIEEVERLVTRQILNATPVETLEQTPQEAIAAGAIALFGEKYGERVRVVSISGFSKELCGGTHCRSTGEIGAFSIEQETGTAAGIRRVEAVTGTAALNRAQARRALLRQLLHALATSEDQAADALAHQQARVKQLTREVRDLKLKLAAGTGEATGGQTDIDGVRLVTRRADSLDRRALRTLSDSLKGELSSGLVVLASATDAGRVAIVVSVTDDLTTRVQAGQIVKALAPLVGGGGGGRPEFAEAGGKDPAQIDTMLAETAEVVRQLLRHSSSH